MERQQAKKLLLMLVAHYTTWKPSRETLDLYEVLLERLPANLTEAAITELFLTSESAFVPAIGTFSRMVAEASVEARGHGRLCSPEEAWAEVWAKISDYGYYRKPGFSNPAITRAVDAIGWQEQLCTNPNVEATRAHFFRLYSVFRERKIHDEVLQITGAFDLARLARETLEIEHEEAQAAVQKIEDDDEVGQG